MVPVWSDKALVFLYILAANIIVSLIYLIIGLITAYKNKGKDPFSDDGKAYVIRFFVMLLCPIIGSLFFLAGHVFYKLIYRNRLDLEDVIFSKERIDSRMMADTDREMDIIPLEEAILVNENKDLRSVIMNVIRGDISDSLASITLALTSEDSEASHYAASVLSDELNKFRINVQKISTQFWEDPDQTEYGEVLIDYMNDILKQHIFSPFEQHKFIEIMDKNAELLYERDPSKFNTDKYEALCMRLLEIKDFEKTEKWATRLSEHFPNELPSYTCKLKLYFAKHDKHAFFETLNLLKNSNVVIDSETLELIRVFS